MIMEDLPSITRGERFTAEETNVLVREVRARKQAIYGNSRNPPKVQEVRKAWEETATIVSATSGLSRSALKCRKRHNDVRRRSIQIKKQIDVVKNGQLRTRDRPKPITENAEKNNSSFPSEAKTLGFGGIEVGYQAPLEEPEDEQPSTQELELEMQRDSIEEQPAVKSGGTTQPRSASVNMVQYEDHPFLDLQQSGFDMLERELLGVRQSISCLNTRLNRIEVLLRPIGHIAASLERIATAVERLTSP